MHFDAQQQKDQLASLRYITCKSIAANDFSLVNLCSDGWKKNKTNLLAENRGSLKVLSRHQIKPFRHHF